MCELWADTMKFKDLYPINFHNVSKRNSCQKICLLSKEHLLPLLYTGNSLQSQSQNTRDRERLIFLCYVSSNVFMPWTSPAPVCSLDTCFLMGSNSKISTDFWVEKVERFYPDSKGVTGWAGTDSTWPKEKWGMIFKRCLIELHKPMKT